MNDIAKKIAIGVAIFVAAVGVLCTLVCAVALCGTDDTEGIPSFSELCTQDSEWAVEQLRGYNEEQLILVWGEPDDIFSGLWGSAWYTDDGDRIVVYYANDGTVEQVNYIHTMKAKIIETNGSALLLEPCAGEDELRSSDRITVGYSSLRLDETVTEQFVEGATVIVGYDGHVAESYPAQITATYGITLVAD